MIVLTFIIMVASFSVVTTLAMSVIEKTPEIAILRTVGATAQSVVRVFLWQGLIVGGAGVGFGVSFAGLTIYALKHIGLWIPNDVYYIDSLPVAFDWGRLRAHSRGGLCGPLELLNDPGETRRNSLTG